MAKLYNRAKMTTATTGTGTITLGSAVSGYQTFASAGVANGDVVSYVIEDNNGNVEFGTGTYTSAGTTLSRTVTQSSISGTWGTTALTLSGTANVYISALAADIIPIDTNGNATVTGTLSMGSGFLRNRIINGGHSVDQRNSGASQTITAGAALAYTVDRWYAYCTGANVTGQRVTGAVANTYYYRFTGAASVTAIGFAQRIEALNSADLAGKTATLSVNLANSLLTTVTWTAYYANTADTFGTLATPTRTQISTGSFTVNSTVTRYSTNISIPAAATTGIEIVLTVGAQTSGTWTIGNVQLEEGSLATSFERRQYSHELLLCQRYYISTTMMVGNSVAYYLTYTFPATMRATPTRTGGGAGYTAFLLNAFGVAHAQTTAASQALTFDAEL